MATSLAAVRALRTPAPRTRAFYFVDGTDAIVGRLAARVAPLLLGKHKPLYTPQLDVGDHVVVTNCARVAFTGRKWQQKLYRSHTGHPGGFREVSAAKMRDERPEHIVRAAVSGMLPKQGVRRRLALGRLHLLVDDDGSSDASSTSSASSSSSSSSSASSSSASLPQFAQLAALRRRLLLDPRARWQDYVDARDGVLAVDVEHKRDGTPVLVVHAGGRFEEAMLARSPRQRRAGVYPWLADDEMPALEDIGNVAPYARLPEDVL